MGVADRLYVDANVFIRLFEGNDALAVALGRLFLTERQSAFLRLATSELTLAELLVLPYRERNDRLIDLYDNWTISNAYLEVGPIDRSVLWYAAVLRAQYRSLKTPDAIHVSTAIGMGCRQFLTGDERLSDKYELVHSRYGITRGPVSIDIVRPDLKVVEKLVGEWQSK